jgi:hypothetical protein
VAVWPEPSAGLVSAVGVRGGAGRRSFGSA